MADAQVVQLADAIVTDLDAATLSVAFTPTRAFLPNVNYEDLATIAVTVIPKGEVSQRSSRANWQVDYQIDIAVRKQVTNDIAAVAELVRLSEEIFDYYRQATPTGRTDVLIARSWLQMISVEDLDKGRVYGSFQSLTFRGWRDT